MEFAAHETPCGPVAEERGAVQKFLHDKYGVGTFLRVITITGDLSRFEGWSTSRFRLPYHIEKCPRDRKCRSTCIAKIFNAGNISDLACISMTGFQARGAEVCVAQRQIVEQ